MKKWRFFLVIVLLLVVIRPMPAYACSCALPDPPDASLNQAAAVFHGRMISEQRNRLRELGQFIPFDASWYGPQINFEVVESWKGVETTTTRVFTGYGGGDCGYDFIVGTEYIVYARDNQGDLTTSICSRTTEYSATGEDAVYLATLTPLTLTTAGLSVQWPIILGLLFISGVGYLWFRQFPKNDRRNP